MALRKITCLTPVRILIVKFTETGILICYNDVT